MPYVRKTINRSKRTQRPARTVRRISTRRKVPGKGRPTVSVQRGQLTADSTVVKLVFAIDRTVTTGIGVVNYIFRGNSLFDPDQSGAGHQPRGFDQWAALYAVYVIAGSSISVRFTTTGALPVQVALLPRTPYSNLPSPATINSYAEAKYSKTGILAQGSGGTRVLKTYMSTAKMYGLSPQAIQSDDRFRSLVGGSPTDEWYWTLAAGAIDNSTAYTIYITATVTYYVKFTGRFMPTQS